MDTEKSYQDNRIEVVFEQKEKLKTNEFSNFLYYVRIVYAYVYKNEQVVRDYLPHDFTQWGEVRKEIIDIVTEGIALEKLGRYHRYNAFKMDLEEDLYIDQITMGSPLIIWFMGVGTVLVLALIISGGELDLSVFPPRLRIKMPAIAKGLRQLKELFRKN